MSHMSHGLIYESYMRLIREQCSDGSGRNTPSLISLLSCIPSIAPHSEHEQMCGACSGACASPLSHLSFACMHRRQFEFRIRGGAFSGGSHKHNTSLQDIPPSTFRDTSYATYTYGSGLGDTTGCHNRLSRPLPPNVCEFAKAVLHATCT